MNYGSLEIMADVWICLVWVTFQKRYFALIFAIEADCEVLTQIKCKLSLLTNPENSELFIELMQIMIEQI